MAKTHARTPVVLATAGAALSLLGGSAFGAGFLINESSASGLGNAFAGGAAAAEDASTLWANAAGLSRLPSSQLVGVLHVIKPSTKFVDQGSLAAAQQALGGDGGDAGGTFFVPNLYFAMPIKDSAWSFGIGFNAPWGLVTEYDDGWKGRFHAIKSSVKTYNLNPAVSWKPAGGPAIGLGLNFQRMQGEFTNQVNYSAALLSAAAKGGIAPGSATYNAIAAATPGLETGARIQGADNSLGWNIGLLWDIDKDSRLGVGYRSRMKYHLSGDVSFTNPALPVLPTPIAPVVGALANGVNTAALYNSGITSDITIPEIVNLSYFRTMGRWDVMADAQWTGWSSIQALSFVRSDGTPLQSTPQNLRDAWKFAFGANYRLEGDWMLRGGVAYDKTPVQTEFRGPRLPDTDRTLLSGGAQYKFSSAFRLDVAGAYVWLKDATIATPSDAASKAAYGVLNGHYDNKTWVLSAQGTWSF